MSIRNKILSMSVMVLCFMLVWPVTYVAGQAEPHVNLIVNETDDQIEITIAVSDVKDIYAWDLVVTYDPLRLKWTGADTLFSGFTVEPVHTYGQIQFAHTSIGNVRGQDGDVELAHMTFERIRGGDTAIAIHSVKLVDSSLALTELAPDVTIVVEDGDQVQPSMMVDLAGHWSEDIVMEAIDLGIVTGYEDHTFRPDQPINREEFSVLLVRALLTSTGVVVGDHSDKGGQGAADGTQNMLFSDVADMSTWALPYVMRASQEQWIIGYEDKTFRGKNVISRQELAVIIARTLEPSEFPNSGGVLSRFVDLERLDSWAKASLALVVEQEIMLGRTPTLLRPHDETTRAEAITMIMRLLSKSSGSY